MTTFTKYLLLQLPGWTLIGLLLLWLWPKTGLDVWIAIAGYAVWVIKDFLLYPLLRSAYEDKALPTGGDRLIGESATVLERLAPKGYVNVAGERWRAEVGAGEPPVEAGERVRITGASGLTLQVGRAADGEGESADLD